MPNIGDITDMDIVVDLDGTLCNIDHRVHLAQAGQWDEFHSLLANDEPHREVLEVVKVLSETFGLFIVTGRSNKFRNQTWNWLSKHKVEADLLLMRPDDDWTPDHELKPRLLLNEAYGGDKEAMLMGVMMVLDDRDKVVEAWRNLGLPCWQVRNGTY